VPREFAVNSDCDEIAPAIRRALQTAGFWVEQSFDLRSALALVPHGICPHHGTALCDCQYNVLLVYGSAQTPASLIVHGHDHQCWIALADNPNGRETTRLAAEIIQALAGAHLITLDEADDAAFQSPIS
jgi:hypothetical protein